MSVYVLSAEDFGSIARTLHQARTGLNDLIFPLSVEETLDRLALSPGKTADEHAQTLIDPFVFRLYIANQMAEEYTYMKPGHTNLVVPIIEFPRSRSLPLRELLSKLDSLAYNVVTNGGNTFLGRKDEEKLDRIISRVQRELVGDGE
jgi:hypothetical protein